MHLAERIAQPLLAGIFIVAGLDAVRDPGPKAALAEEVGAAITGPLGISAETTTLVRFNGLVQVGAASLLALDIVPRLAATALVGSLIPTTLAGHRFWEASDPEAQAGQRLQFLKNLAIIGGLIARATEPSH